MVILVPFLFAVAIWIVLLFGKKKPKPWAEDLGSEYAIALLFSFFFGAVSLVIGLSGILMILVNSVCRWKDIRPLKSAVITFAMIPLTFTCVGYFSWTFVQGRMETQQKYPFQSLESRLAYEMTRRSQEDLILPIEASGEYRIQATHMTDTIDRRVQYGRDLREMMLYELHQSQLDAFARSPGFGPVRGIRYYSEEQLRTEPRPRITPPPAPQTPYVPDTGEATPPIAADQELEAQRLASEPASPLDREKLRQLHLASSIDFVNPQGFGLVRSLQEVAGFEPHAFSKIPKLPNYSDQSSSPCGGEHQPQPAASDEDWIIVSLQLVSLLKHEKPLVYATKDLPQMEVLTSEDVPARELNTFEAAALPQVLKGESLVVQESANRIHMLGAVRAGETCSKCHQVPRLSLLGAFSYELARTQPVPEKPAAPAAGPEL